MTENTTMALQIDMSKTEVSYRGNINPAFVTSGDDITAQSPEGREPINTTPQTGEEPARSDICAVGKTSGRRAHSRPEGKGGHLKEDESEGSSPAVRKQVVYSAMAAMPQVILGTTFGLSGVILPQLTDQNSHDLFLNTSQVALFGSVGHLGGMVGCMVGGALSVYLGQRVILLVVMPFCLVLWLGMAFSPTVLVLLVVRALLGMVPGFISATCSNYMVEITHSSSREALMPFVEIWMQLGYLLVYSVGSLPLTWREVMLVCGCATAVPVFIALLFLPNSPRWLLTRGREQEAYEALVFLRGPHFNSEAELQSIVDHLQEEATNKKSAMEQLRQMTHTNILYRMALVTSLTVFLHFSGLIPMVTYAITILQAANSSLNSYGSLVSVACLRVVSTVVYMVVVQRVGRRVLVITFSLMCAASLLLLGGYFWLHSSGADVSAVTWLPLFSLLVYMPLIIFLDLTFCIMRSEIFPNSLRVMAVSVVSVIVYLSAFTSTILFPIMTEAMMEHSVFCIYALSCLLITLTTALLLPDTRGLSLEEVDHVFKHGNKVVLSIPSVCKKWRVTQ